MEFIVLHFQGKSTNGKTEQEKNNKAGNNL